MSSEAPSRPHHRSASDRRSSAGERARRDAKPRIQVTEPVSFRKKGREVSGWALNVSRGGIRAALEELVEVGEGYEVVVGEEGEPRKAQIVWVKGDRGGCIVGAAFEGGGSEPPPPQAAIAEE